MGNGKKLWFGFYSFKSPKNSPKVLNTEIYEKVNSSSVKWFRHYILLVEISSAPNFVTFHQRISHLKVSMIKVKESK